MKQAFEKMEAERVRIEKELVERYMKIGPEGEVKDDGNSNFSAPAGDFLGNVNAAAAVQEKPVEFTGETSFYVREQYVLAHSNNVDIVSNTNFVGHKLLRGLKFYKVITKR